MDSQATFIEGLEQVASQYFEAELDVIIIADCFTAVGLARSVVANGVAYVAYLEIKERCELFFASTNV